MCPTEALPKDYIDLDMEKLCVKVALWGGQWDNIKLFEETTSLLPKLNYPPVPPSPVANNPEAVAAQQDFLRELSMCHTVPVEHLFQVIRLLGEGAHYRISEVAITKRRFLIQHEGVVVRAHHQSLPEDRGFFIFINRGIDFYRLGPFSLSRKFATDHVDCRLTQTPAHSSTVIWRVAPNNGYTFNLTLLEISLLLNMVSSANRTYNTLQRNCFWFAGLAKVAIERIIRRQQPFGPQLLFNLAQDRKCLRIGTANLSDEDMDQFLTTYYNDPLLQQQQAQPDLET
ncbi:hypothetical protein F5887DRAFT_958261 [Amanita rubescens]|nr:hypothetical protein F5887DRAFT_958261 [Amanita rubescens]